ncbi:MAG: hemerythrin domain-containing protein [Acidobacteria bacterium]|nr:hemerythrin domain-containing protein [Acidobacteriota bacterium]
MSPDHPVTELMNDHRLIENVLSALERRLAAGGGEFPGEFVAQALAFFVEFADLHHHHKEEEVLFPALAQHGVPVQGGPIGVMLNEHTMGRQLLAGIRGNLEAAGGGGEQARAAVRADAARYIELLRHHIWKEDNILFRMAQQQLGAKEADEMLERFHQGVDGDAVRRHVDFATNA